MSYPDDSASHYAEEATTLASQELESRDRAMVYAISALASAVQAAGECIANGLSEISVELMPGSPTRSS